MVIERIDTDLKEFIVMKRLMFVCLVSNARAMKSIEIGKSFDQDVQVRIVSSTVRKHHRIQATNDDDLDERGSKTNVTPKLQTMLARRGLNGNQSCFDTEE